MEPGCSYSAMSAPRYPLGFAEHRELAGGGVAVDGVRVRIARRADSRPRILHPHRAFGELEPFRELEDLRVGRHDAIDRGVESQHLHVHLLRRDGVRLAQPRIELEVRIAQPDVVGRRVRDRPIRAEHRDLDLLAGLDVATDDQPVRRVPASHYRPAALPRRACELAVDPHLGVVVDGGLEHGRATRGVEAADALRNRHPDAIPVECEAPVAAARVERRRIDRGPARIVEIAPARVRLDVVGLHGGAGGLLVRSGRLEVGLDDFRIGVAPRPLDEGDALRRSEVDGGQRRPDRGSRIGRREGGRKHRQHEDDEGLHGRKSPARLTSPLLTGGWA